VAAWASASPEESSFSSRSGPPNSRPGTAASGSGSAADAPAVTLFLHLSRLKGGRPGMAPVNAGRTPQPIQARRASRSGAPEQGDTVMKRSVMAALIGILPAVVGLTTRGTAITKTQDQ
jgi:hypothetical protein